MKLGILGGTFDPIHVGHLRCAEEIRELFALDQILFIPSSQPPHKDYPAVTPFARRAQMVQLAIAGQPAFSCSDLENKRAGLSYSVATVEQLLALHPEAALYFIMGQDAFQTIQTWKDWERLLTLCHMIVMTRAGCKNEGLTEILPPDHAGRYRYDAALDGYQGPAGKNVLFRQVSFLEVSSSNIRNRIKAGKSVRYLVPEAVLAYIADTGCYGQ
jgi:nicotinate-nucleotide adenylyltransferase